MAGSAWAQEAAAPPVDAGASAAVTAAPAAPAQDAAAAEAAVAAAKAQAAAAAAQAQAAAEAQQKMAQQLAETQAALQAANRRIDEMGVKLDSVCSQVTGVCTQMETHATAMTGVQSQLKEIEQRSRVTEDAVTGLRYKPYGYIKFDMAYDSTRTSGTDAPAFVLSETEGYEDDQHLSMTVRQTRIGMDVFGPEIEGAKSSGKIEIDFYDSATVENKAAPMLRQAYWILQYPTWNVLAGQTWEVFSPAFPNMINYPYLALQGNPGYREPLIRYERTDKVFNETVLQTDLALARGIGANIRSASSLDDEDSDEAWPNIQARVGVKVPTNVGKTDKTPGKPFIIGLSGELGQEELDGATSGEGAEYMTYAANIDWSVPVCTKLSFNGEVWGGRNLDGFMGGIGQGINTTLGKPIDAYGGWSQLSYAHNAKWTFSLGGGIDDPANDDLSAAMRSCNSTVFTNAMYKLNDRTLVGVEVSRMQTDYVDSEDGTNTRVQGAVQYNF